MRRSRVLLLAVFVALVVGACGGAGSGAVRDEGPVGVGEKAAVSPAGAAGQDTSPVVPGTMTTGGGFVYLLRFDQPVPSRRTLRGEVSVPEASLRALLQGPTLAERVLRYSSAIPDDTRLLDYAVVNRTAIVDLSDMPAASADSEKDALLALYQVVYTLTANGSLDAVQMRVDGRPYGLGSLTGGTSATEAPLTRADLSFVVDATTLPGSTGCAVAKDGAAPFKGTPSVAITRPAVGERIADAIQLRGTVQSAGGPIVIRLIKDELEVASRVIDEKCRGSFAATIPVPRSLVGAVDLEVIAPGVEGAPAASASERIVIEE